MNHVMLFHLSFCLCGSIIQVKVMFFVLCLQHFRGLSFPTISSVGPNAAIIHYAPQAETCAELDPDRIYLFDSGAQVCLLFYMVYLLKTKLS